MSQPAAAVDLAPGSQLLTEIREQPHALRRVAAGSDAHAALAELLRDRRLDMIRMVGHGSSDNAASYGVYAFGLLAGWTAIRDSISLSVYYGARLDLTRSCVVGLSQSGQTPDVVEYVERARTRGAYTVAITNDGSSELAAAADAVLALDAGPEQAVAATKTYTATVASLALLAGHVAGRGETVAAALRETADVMDGLLPALERRLVEVARPLAPVARMFVVGRGPEFATAREISLKLLETCRVAAEPLTATGLMHGPVAAVDSLFPVWLLAAPDQSLSAVRAAAEKARAAGATVIASGAAAHEVDAAAVTVSLPPLPLPLLGPLLSVIPGQLLALALARSKGLDPDQPAGLTKITLAH